MLLFEHARSKRIRRVTWSNRDLGLDDNRPAIELFRDEMDTATMDDIAGFYGTGVRVESFVSWQQGRMYVDQPSLIMVYKVTAQDAHEAGEDDKVGGMRVDEPDQLVVERFAIGERSMIERVRDEPGMSGAFQPIGIRDIRDDCLDTARVAIVTRVDVIQKGLQIASAT